MPYRLPTGFPTGLSDADLAGVVDEVLKAARERYGDNVGAWLPELQLALASIAITEQSRRQLATGSKITLAALLVAGAALVVAVITLFVG